MAIFIRISWSVSFFTAALWTDEFSSGVLAIGTILTVVAILGKFVSGYGVPWTKMSAVAIGIGMIPRGEVGLIFADIGRRGGLLSDEVFSAILIMVMVTTFITPPLLKWIFSKQPPPEHSGPLAIKAVRAEAGGPD